MCYDYARMLKDIEMLTDNYNIIERFSIGKSVMQKDIPCLKIGKGKKKLLLSGAYHGLEYLTAAFLIKFVSNYTVKLMTETEYFGYDIKRLYSDITVYVVPMVNPDGVDIALNGLDITNEYHRHLISMVGIHSFNHVWQAILTQSGRWLSINRHRQNTAVNMRSPSPKQGQLRNL